MSNFPTPTKSAQPPKVAAHCSGSQNGHPPGPPNSFEAEQSTLGAMMLQASVIAHVQSTLTRGDFHREIHRKIFDAVCALHDNATPVDLITVVEELRRRGQLEEVSGVAYLTALLEACPSAANVPAYAATVRDLAQRRAILLAAEEARALALSPDATEAQRANAVAVLTRAVEQSAEKTEAKRFPAHNLTEILARPRLEYLIQDILLERGTGVISADYGAFKSFNALDMGLCVALGKDWHGRKVKRGCVVYVMPEGAYTTADRLKAWMIRYGLAEPPESFYIIEKPTRLSEEAVCAALIAELRELNPALVIADTVAKCNVGRDENDSGAMGLFTDGMERISRELETFVLGIHHNNRNGQFRGSNSLPANVDAHIVLEKSAGRVVTFKCDRVKGAPFEPFSLIGRVVELPDNDEYGRPLTSLVFEPTDAAAMPKADETRDKVLEVLRRAPNGGYKAKEWQEAVETQTGCKSSRFYDHRDSLVEAERVKKDGVIYRVV